MRLVRRLASFELPAREIDPAGPHHRNLAPEPVDRDRLVAHGSQAERADQAAFGGWTVARLAGAPARAVAEFGSVDAEQADAGVAAAEAVPVDDVGARAIDNHDGDGGRSGVVSSTRLP